MDKYLKILKKILEMEKVAANWCGLNLIDILNISQKAQHFLTI